ncbi:ATP-binding protein [Paraburkholderia xenovorans]
MTRPVPKYRREIGVGAMDRSITEGPQVYEWCYRSRTGADMLSEAIATYVPLRERAVVMVQFRDISAEDTLKQTLRRYESRLREFMQDLGEGVAVLTPTGEVQFVSVSGRRALGLAEGAPMGDAIRRLAQPASIDAAVWGLRSADRQAGLSSSKAGGNGIGLSLCKNIVTRHGGEIWAKPAQQGGLECSFSLPLVAAPPG